MSGEKIAYFEGCSTPQSTKHSVFLSGKNIEPIGDLKYLNHSCNPNASFVDRWLIAKCEIKEGEEITVDYSHTETNCSNPFSCNCRSRNCRGNLI